MVVTATVVRAIMAEGGIEDAEDAEEVAAEEAATIVII
jgi:heptaprenylglyceryl phosphate synthase